MIGGKNPLLVDRRVYAFKGKWTNPNDEDLPRTIFYFVSNKPTIRADFVNGREELSQELEITVFGEHAFCVEDEITLQTGEKFIVESISNIYYEPNIAIRDFVKPRIESQVLTLK